MARSITAITIATVVAVTAYLLNSYLSYDSGWMPFRPPPGVLSAHNKANHIGNVDSTLYPLLTTHAKVHLPGSAGFNTSTDRWNINSTPTFEIVVEVATEADVQAAIQWANNASLPFLAVSGGHGVVQSLNRFEGGVGIWMRGMRDVKVLEGGETARIEGGVLSGELVHSLWEEGKMTGE
jgi:FAD/FMN-containing dehydrogenase